MPAPQATLNDGIASLLAIANIHGLIIGYLFAQTSSASLQIKILPRLISPRKIHVLRESGESGLLCRKQNWESGLSQDFELVARFAYVEFGGRGTSHIHELIGVELMVGRMSIDKHCRGAIVSIT